MINYQSMSCCGVKEITWLSHHPNRPTEALKRLLKPFMAKGRDGWLPNGQMIPRIPAFFIFTQARTEGGVDPALDLYGDRFAALLERLNLGEVVRTTEQMNRNSGNQVTVYVWKPNERNIRRWYFGRKR